VTVATGFAVARPPPTTTSTTTRIAIPAAPSAPPPTFGTVPTLDQRPSIGQTSSSDEIPSSAGTSGSIAAPALMIAVLGLGVGAWLARRSSSSRSHAGRRHRPRRLPFGLHLGGRPRESRRQEPSPTAREHSPRPRSVRSP
jgi:hypothetical protein